jgi:octaprenyl-diphosphate synthase
MPNHINEIQKIIDTEIQEFHLRFREAMKSDVPLMDAVMNFIVKRKGKQIRPMFIFLAAKMIGEVGDHTYHAANLIELLHTATLIHDDVVDDSMQRRGFFSLNALWGNKIAVLVGDYLLSKGLLLSIDNNAHYLLQITSQAVREMSEGELLQIEKARRLDIQEEVYFQIIYKKTASLIAAACASGVASVGADAETIEKAKQLGAHIGMAFQIRDDLFDFGDGDAGKPQGNDLQEKKMTLPLIYALNQIEPAQRKYYINIIKHENTNPDRIREVSEFVIHSTGINYTRKKMYEYRQKAYDVLATFPDTAARTALHDLITFVTERTQ